MRLRRPLLLTTILVLILTPSLLAPPSARAADGWLPGPPMLTPQMSPDQAFTLPNGEVLVIGTDRRELDVDDDRIVIERYDPATRQWRLGASAPQHRDGQATLLSDGSLLFISAAFPDSSTAFVARYFPVTDEWRLATSIQFRRNTFKSILLNDGRVLLVGVGFPISAVGAAIYDPNIDRWQEVSPTNFGREEFTLAKLHDGRVMLLGGTGEGEYRLSRDLDFRTSTEIYDPATDRWTIAAPTIWPHHLPTATTLLDGSILVVGDGTAERYFPGTDTWQPTGIPGIRHDARHNAVLLADGRVLVVGGRDVCLMRSCFRDTLAAEIYDPQTNDWAPIAPASPGHVVSALTLLPDGQAMLVGPTYVPSPPRPDLPPPPPPPSGASVEFYDPGTPATHCFPETGHCLTGRFLTHWQTTGGLATYGYPLTAPRREFLEDGLPYLVQYFERARFEYHPENAPPYDVLLGQFGRRLHPADPPAPELPGARHFPETGHNLSGPFRAYWEANGDLPLFGYPLTEEITETLEDGRAYTVQYFERARLEHHPENTTPFDILLGQFGRRILADPPAFPPACRAADLAFAWSPLRTGTTPGVYGTILVIGNRTDQDCSLFDIPSIRVRDASGHYLALESYNCSYHYQTCILGQRLTLRARTADNLTPTPSAGQASVRFSWDTNYYGVIEPACPARYQIPAASLQIVIPEDLGSAELPVPAEIAPLLGNAMCGGQLIVWPFAAAP